MRTLDEFTAEELLKELQDRENSRKQGLCDYCKRPRNMVPACRFPERHGSPAELAAEFVKELVTFPTKAEPNGLPFEVVVGQRRAVVEEFDHQATGASARACRLRRGFTLSDVANKMSCSITYVSRIERGSKPWSWELANNYAAALKALSEEEIVDADN